MSFPKSLALAALFAVPLSAVAGPQQPRKDPQSAFEPRSKPGAGQKFLEKFVGEWDVVKIIHPRSGEPIRMSGTCTQAMVHDGRFLRSEFVFERGGTRTTGLGIIGFEAETGKFTSVWTDSRSTQMSLRQSQGPFDGREIVLHSRSLGGDGNEPRRSRTVTHLEEGGRKIVHHAYVTGPDGKEWLMMELLMTKREKEGTPKR